MKINIKFLERNKKFNDTIRFLERNKKFNNTEKLLTIARYFSERELEGAILGFIDLQKYYNFEGLKKIHNKLKEDVIALVKKEKEEVENFEEVINWINN
jgi:hypothetical protein